MPVKTTDTKMKVTAAKPATKVVAITKPTTKTVVVLKKDGTPDKRFKANKKS